MEHFELVHLVPIVVGPILMWITQLAKNKLGLTKNFTHAFMIIIGSIGYAVYVMFAPENLKHNVHELVAISVSTAGLLYQTLKSFGMFKENVK